MALKVSCETRLTLQLDYLDNDYRSSLDLESHSDHPSSLNVAVLSVQLMTSCPYVSVGRAFSVMESGPRCDIEPDA